MHPRELRLLTELNNAALLLQVHYLQWIEPNTLKKLILWFVVAVIIALAVLGGVKTALGKGISLNLDEILTLGIKSPWSETLEQWESPSVVANPVPVSHTFVPSEIVKLGKCESQNDPTVIHLNDGRKGLHSYGQFQWQIPTADKWVIKLDCWKIGIN